MTEAEKQTEYEKMVTYLRDTKKYILLKGCNKSILCERKDVLIYEDNANDYLVINCNIEVKDRKSVVMIDRGAFDSMLKQLESDWNDRIKKGHKKYGEFTQSAYIRIFKNGKQEGCIRFSQHPPLPIKNTGVDKMKRLYLDFLSYEYWLSLNDAVEDKGLPPLKSYEDITNEHEKIANSNGGVYVPIGNIKNYTTIESEITSHIKKEHKSDLKLYKGNK